MCRTCLSTSSATDVVVRANNVTFGYVHDKLILDEVTFSVRKGSKVTIMGQNGSGKSTLIKLINGSLKPTYGAMTTGVGLTTATAQQTLPREDNRLTVREFFKKYLNGDDRGIEPRISKALLKVNIDVPLTRELFSFSGGQQARLLLAAALIQDADILLLDEPTNNLDIMGISVLTDFIQNYEDTCIVISHDEEFLNSFTDSVLYLDVHKSKVEQYKGDYNYVKVEIQDRIRRENAENARLSKMAQQKKDQANVFANKGGNMRKVAKKLRETAEDLQSELVDVRKEDKALRPFKIPMQSNIAGGKVLEINSIPFPRKSIPMVPLLSPITLRKNFKLLIAGPNGIGKTTLLESIVTSITSSSAAKLSTSTNALNSFTSERGLRIGYYRQDFATLDFNASVLHTLTAAASSNPGEMVTEQMIRTTAAAFLITKDIISRPVGSLSEGQKGLVSFAKLTLEQPGLLIMDEPTNHINFRHIPAIASALKAFEGALILVSHDRNFVKSFRFDEELDIGQVLENYQRNV